VFNKELKRERQMVAGRLRRQFDMAAIEATGNLKFDIFDTEGMTKAVRE
jgi:hypothetical protein